MTVKKSTHPHSLPGIHPGLQQRLREAEEAEKLGVTPRSVAGPQKILRPTLDASEPTRRQQVRTIGLVDPAYRATQDGLATLAAQAAFRPGEDLDALWDSLAETDKIRAGATERFRLEMEASLRLAARPWEAPHKLGGRLDARGLRRSAANLRAEIDAYAYLLAPDSLALLLRFVDETGKLVELCLKHRAVQGLDNVTLHDILRDLMHKLVYQELNSRRRAMGDRGIRRICGNIELAEQVYQQLKRQPDFSPRERLLMRVIHVHQDLGHTAYAARSSFRGGKLHRAYGARIFTDEMNRLRLLLTHADLELARLAVASHSSEELPFKSQRVLALVRAVDHLAPFAPYRVYQHLAGLPGASDYLDDLLERARAGSPERYVVAKQAFRRWLDDQPIGQALQDDLWAAFLPVEKLAELTELGPLAGEVSGLRLDPAGCGTLTAQLKPDPFAERYQTLFDQQQAQLARLVRVCGLSSAQLTQGSTVAFSRPGFGALMIQRPSGP